MSGTSLDGLDICYAKFVYQSSKWHYEILNTKMVSYPTILLEKLTTAANLSGLDLFLLDKELGVFFGKSVNEFISENAILKSEIDAVASHGQTIFHQPNIGFTCQIGCGESIAVETEIDTINDFRKKDVLNGGQGAPLVPIGDKLLFSHQADAFLNIGGFANFSKINSDDSVTAYDICPANSIVNHLTRQMDLEYDKDGSIASENKVNDVLLEKLNTIQTYSEKQPTSLGWEWVEKQILPLLNTASISLNEKIATVTEHSAFQIAKRLNENKCQSVFITGGGAKNKFLIRRIEHHFNGRIVIPNEETIDFKEALIFAFLGVLFLENIPNCLPSVTGGKKAVIGGVMHKR